LANALIDLGLEHGDRVGLFMQNSPQFVISYFGVSRAGGVVVSLNPMFKQAELEYEINDAGCRVCLAADNLYPELEKIRPRVDLKQVIVTSFSGYCPADSFPQPPPDVTSSPRKFEGTLDFAELLAGASDRPVNRVEDLTRDLALLQYTGGTTGLPKGAMIAHHALDCAACAANNWFNNNSDDVFLGVTPYFHIMGVVQVMCGPLVVCRGLRAFAAARFGVCNSM
jgi:long-chain acyl-CoA synthetase